MTLKKMTTKQFQKAWKEIAIAYEKPFNQRTAKQRRLSRYGLCFAFYGKQNPKALVLPSLYSDMERCLANFSGVPLGHNAWFDTRMYDTNSKSFEKEDYLRSLYAYMFSNMTKEQFLDICYYVLPLA